MGRLPAYRPAPTNQVLMVFFSSFEIIFQIWEDFQRWKAQIHRLGQSLFPGHSDFKGKREHQPLGKAKNLRVMEYFNSGNSGRI